MEVLYEHVIKRQADQLETQGEQIRRLTEAMERLSSTVVPASGSSSSAPRVIQNAAQAGHHNIQTNVVLNVWGKEDVARIAASDIQKVIEAGGGTTSMVCGILRLIYHKVPENRNAYRLAQAKHKKDSTAMVFEGETSEEGRWVPRPRGDLLPVMVEKSADQVFEKQFSLLGDDKVPQETKRAVDRAAKDLSESSPVGGPVSARLLSEVSPTQKAVLLENRPEK